MSIRNFLPALVVLCVLFVGCAKEEVAAPVGTPAVTPLDGAKKSGARSSGGDPVVSGGNSDGISDDGDDLGDSEVGRRKVRPTPPVRK